MMTSTMWSAAEAKRRSDAWSHSLQHPSLFQLYTSGGTGDFLLHGAMMSLDCSEFPRSERASVRRLPGSTKRGMLLMCRVVVLGWFKSLGLVTGRYSLVLC